MSVHDSRHSGQWGEGFLGRLKSSERGAQLIEFALILPVLLSLLFGIVTGGVAFSHNLAMDNAARETARYGATLPIDGDMPTWLNQMADVAISTATGTLNTGVDGRQVCVAYVYPVGTNAHDSTTRLIVDSTGTRSTDNRPCVADGRPADERRVQVVVQRNTDLIVFYFTRTINLNGQSVARYERHNS